MASTFTGSDAGRAGLEITEVDGVPDIFGVNKITVSNTTLTDDGNGAVTITTGGGGGGSGTVTSVSTSLGGISIANATTTPAISGTLVVANGGTGATALTDGGILLGSGTGVITATVQPINGQLVIGSTGSDPAIGSLTGGTGITITDGAGSITIDNDITDNNQLTNGAGYTTNVGTVTSITAGSNLNAGGAAITGAGLIDLLFDTYTSSAPAGGAAGFVGPPPDDTGKMQSGRITVDVMISPGGGAPPASTPAYIPLWVNA